MRHVAAIFLGILVLSVSPVFAVQQPAVIPQGLSVRQATEAQIFRFAREQYRKGNYSEAIKAFKKMLAIDCRNAVAQYHLQKIAKEPGYSDLESYLKNLPCPKYDFTEEDFLPASIYYENDPDLLQEQLIAYNKRYRTAKATLNEQAENYNRLAKELETKVASLQSQLQLAQAARSDASAVNQKLEESRATANRMAGEVAALKETLANDRARSQKEIELLRNEIALEEKKGTALKVRPGASPAASETAAKLQQARTLLREKERALEAKDKQLITLQEKFDDIQRRLELIQANIEEKNAQLKSLGERM